MMTNEAHEYESSNDVEQVLIAMRSTADPVFVRDLEQQILNQFREKQISAAPVKRFFPRRWGWAIAGILFAVLIGLVATPYGRVLAEGVIELFRRTESSQRTIIYQANPESEATELDQSVGDIEVQAGFDILEPVELPGGVYFRGGLFDAERQIAWLDYGVFLLGQQRELDFVQDESMPPLVGPDTVVENVTVNDLDGQYFRGAWISDDNVSQVQAGETGEIELTWDSNIPMETLVWQQHEIVFVLIVPGDDSPLSGKQAMLNLAQSLVPEVQNDEPEREIVAQSTMDNPSYFLLSQYDQINYTFEAFDPSTAPAFEESELEQLTNEWQIPLPQYLPQGFAFKRAFHFPEDGTFTLMYMLEDKQERVFYLHYIPKEIALQYLQQAAQQPTGKIGASAVVNQVQLANGLSAEWVAGEWSLRSSTADANRPFEDGDQIEGAWDKDIPFYRLRWEQADWLISLEHGGSLMWQLSQEDLVNIAGSLQ